MRVTEAVDVAFKSMFVLDLQYPALAHSNWSFLQKTVYKLERRFDDAVKGGRADDRNTQRLQTSAEDFHVLFLAV